MAQTAINPDTGERVQWNADAGEWQPMASTPAAPPPRARGSMLDPLLQGATFGFSDELAKFGGRLGAALAGAPPERVQAAAERQGRLADERLEDMRERAFWPSMAAEVGGAMVTGGPVAKGLMAGLQGLGRVGAPMAAAGIEGGVAGAGAADDNRLLGAGMGAMMGPAVAGAMPAVGAAGRWAGGKMAPYARKLYESPPTTAARILNERLTATGETPTRLLARQRQLGPEATLVDVAGPAGLGMGQGVLQADRSGQAAIQARRALTERAGGSTRRLRRDVQGTTGIDQRLQQSLDAVRERQVLNSGPAYDRAYSRTISMTPELKSLLDRPAMQRAFNEAKEQAANRGEELPPFFRLDDFGNWEESGVIPDMRAWDVMKQGIDDIIDAERDAVTGRLSRKGVTYVKMKDDLLTQLDEINPDYRDARRIFAGDAAIESAMRQGRKFLNMDADVFQNAVKNYSPSEREAALTGAVEAIRQKMGRAREGAGEIGEFRFLETGNMRDKLRAILPEGREGDRQLAEILRTVGRERTFAENRAALVGGSQTAPRQAAGEALESGVAIPTTVEVLANPMAGMANMALRGASEALSGVNQRTIDELSGMLFDPSGIPRAIGEMQRRGIPQPQLDEIMARYARGGAYMAPALGLGMGQIVNQ